MIRNLTKRDLADVRGVFFNSFSEEEASITFQVISQLVSQATQPASHCLGYEQDGKMVGAVAVSPVYFSSCTDMTAYLLAPLAVHQLHQKKRIATQLIEAARAHFTESNVDALLVYGDPQFYGRYGFDAGLGQHFRPPYPLEYEFGWQVMMLNNRRICNMKLNFTCVDALSDAALW